MTAGNRGILCRRRVYLRKQHTYMAANKNNGFKMQTSQIYTHA